MPPKTRRGSVAVAVAEPTAELSNGSEEGVIDEVVDRVVSAMCLPFDLIHCPHTI